MALCLTTIPTLQIVADATLTNGEYVCSSGSYLLLTMTEINTIANKKIEIKDAFGTATVAQYEAVSLVFGAILAAAAVIWAVKRVLYLFAHPSEA